MSSAENPAGGIELDADEDDVSDHFTVAHADNEEFSGMDELEPITVRNAPYATGIGPGSEFDRAGSVIMPSGERTTAVDRATVGRIDGDLQAGTVLRKSDIDTITGDSRAAKMFASETDNLDVKGDIIVDQKGSPDRTSATNAFRGSDNPLVVADTIQADQLDRNSYGGLLVADEIDAGANHGNMVTIAEEGDAQRTFSRMSNVDLDDFKQKIWENRDQLYGIPLLNPESLSSEEVEGQSIAEADNHFEEQFFQREEELQQLFDQEVKGTPEEASEVLGYLGGLNGLEEQRYAGLIDRALKLDEQELNRFSSLEQVLFGTTSDLEEEEWKDFISRMSDEGLVDFSQNLPEDRPDYDTSNLYRNAIEGLLHQGKPLQDLSLSTPMEQSVFNEGFKPIGEIVEEAYESMGEDAANLAYLAEFAGEEEALGLEQLTEDYRNGDIDPENLEDIIQERIEERKAELTEKALDESELLEGFYDQVLARTPDGEYQMMLSGKNTEYHGGLRLKDTDLDPEEAVEQITDMKHNRQLEVMELFDLEADDIQNLRQQAAGLSRVKDELEEEYERFVEDAESYAEKFDSVKDVVHLNESNDQVVKQLVNIEETIIEGLSDGEMSREQAEKLVGAEKDSYLLRQKEEIDSLYGGMGEFIEEFSEGTPEQLVESPGFQVEYFMSGESVSQDQDQVAGEAYQEGLNLLERVAHGGGNFELEDEYMDDSIEEIEEDLQEVGQKLSESDGRPDQELIDRKNELKERLAFQKRKTVFEDLGLEYADSPEEEQDLDADYFEDEIEDPGELRSAMNQMAQEFMSNSEEEFQPNSEVARDLYNEASNIEVSLGSEEGHLNMETWDKTVDDMPGPVDSVPCVLPGGINEDGVLHYMNDPGTQVLDIDSVQGEGIAINNLVEHDGSDYLFVHSVESEDNLTASTQYTEAIKQGIEEYAQDIGVEGVIYNTDAHNEAPNDFIDNLGEIEPGLEEQTLEVDKKGENVNRYLDMSFPEVDGYVQEMPA